VERRGDRCVVRREGAGGAHARRVERGGEAARLRERLPAEPAEEALAVDPVPEAPGVERAGGAEQVEGDRDAGAGPDLGGQGVAALAQVLRHHVAAEREAGEDERTAGPLGREARHDRGEIAGVAGVVEAREPVRRPGAAPEVDRHRREPALEREGHEAADVRRARRALEPVQHDQQRCVRALPAGVAIDVEEVAVGELPPLAPPRRAREGARDVREDRHRMC